MYYWNQDNFEGMAALADELSREPAFAAFADHLRLRGRGLRQQAIAALRQFIAEANTRPFQERRGIVHRIMSLHHANPRVHTLIAQPLYQQLILPTLDQWIEQEPSNPVPLRWRCQDDDLRRAIALDPNEQIARRRLVARLLAGIDYSIHELPNGYGYCGSPAADLTVLDEVDRLTPAINDERLRTNWQNEAAHLRAVVTGYIRYAEEGRSEPFRDWAESNGLHLEHRWGHIPYSQ